MYDAWYRITRNKSIGINLFVENIIQLIYVSLLRPGEVAIDGGANRGVHTKPLAAAVGETGTVYAFEAIPKLAEELGVALRALPQVVVIKKALGAFVGETEFSYVRDSHTRSGIRPQDGLSERQVQSIERIRIPLTRIDAECESASVRFIKLDLEGGELDALKGAVAVLRSSRPCIVLESGREKSATLYQYDRAQWFGFFEATGYCLFDIFGRPFSLAEWDKPRIPPYCIAVARDDDVEFVNNRLPGLISALAVPYSILMEKLPSEA